MSVSTCVELELSSPSGDASRRHSLEREKMIWWSLAGKRKVLLILLAISIAIQIAYRVLLPLGYEQMVNSVTGHGGELFSQIVAFVLVGWVLTGLGGMAQDHVASRLSAGAGNDLRRRLYAHTQWTPLSSNWWRNSSDILSRFTNDLPVLETFVQRTMPTLVYSVLNVVFSLFLLFVIDPFMALLTLVIMPLALLGPKVLGNRAHQANFQCKQVESETLAMVKEDFFAREVIRVFGLESYRMSLFVKHIRRLFSANVSASLASAMVGRATSQTILFLQVIMMCLGCWQCARGVMTPGALVGFMALLLNIANASSHLSGAASDIFSASAAICRVNDLLQSESEENNTDFPHLSPMTKHIRIKNLWFSWPGERMAIRGVNLDINIGSSVVLVGGSGSGKSSLIKILLKMYQPDRGGVFIDGHPIHQYSDSSYRDQIGVVFQQAVLFDNTVLENIRAGNLEASVEDVYAAAKMAEVHQTILALSDGYQTRLGENGAALSGGQRQRIAIARALVRKPRLLILDEVTSAQDPLTTLELCQTLNRIAGSCTVIRATHNLSTVSDSDHILVMDQGRIVEQGNRETLLRRRSAFYELVNGGV